MSVSPPGSGAPGRGGSGCGHRGAGHTKNRHGHGHGVGRWAQAHWVFSFGLWGSGETHLKPPRHPEAFLQELSFSLWSWRVRAG